MHKLNWGPAIVLLVPETLGTISSTAKEASSFTSLNQASASDSSVALDAGYIHMNPKEIQKARKVDMVS